jgi:hypothetical protein
MHSANQLQLWRINQAARRIAHKPIVNICMNYLARDNRLI